MENGMLGVEICSLSAGVEFFSYLPAKAARVTATGIVGALRGNERIRELQRLSLDGISIAFSKLASVAFGGFYGNCMVLSVYIGMSYKMGLLMEMRFL
jgi:hypothetical protein